MRSLYTSSHNIIILCHLMTSSWLCHHDVITMMSYMMSCMMSSLWGHPWHHKLLMQFLFLFSSFNHMHIIRHLPTCTYSHTLLYISIHFCILLYTSTHLHTLLHMWRRLSPPPHLFHFSKTQHKTHTYFLSSSKIRIPSHP